MTITEYIKYRRGLKCKYVKPKVPAGLHDRLGRALCKEIRERDQMEVEKPALVLLPPGELDFIF